MSGLPRRRSRLRESTADRSVLSHAISPDSTLNQRGQAGSLHDEGARTQPADRDAFDVHIPAHRPSCLRPRQGSLPCSREWAFRNGPSVAPRDLPHWSFPTLPSTLWSNLILAVIPDPVCLRPPALSSPGATSVFDKFLADGARPSLARRLANALFEPPGHRHQTDDGRDPDGLRDEPDSRRARCFRWPLLRDPAAKALNAGVG